MSNAKIMKVKLSNIPKEFKPIELSSKKTYYFKEFNQKLAMIKEIIQETGKNYKMTIEICDFDAPDVIHFVLEDYLLTDNMPTKLSDIVEREALRDRDADEKGVTEEYKKAFMDQMKESEAYDVADNEQVKKGNIKKAGLLSKLLPIRNKNEETILISEDEEQELEETKKDSLALAKADELHKADEVVHLSDSHEETFQAEEKEMINPQHTVNNSNQTHTNEDHLVNSVSSSENDINGDNNVDDPSIESPINHSEVIYSTENQHNQSVVEKKNDNHEQNQRDWLEEKNQSIDKEYALEELSRIEIPKIVVNSSNHDETNFAEREEAEFIRGREQLKQQVIEKESSLLESDIKDFILEEGKNLENELMTFMEENKPDYDSYIQELHDKEAVVNKQVIEALIQQIEEQHSLILAKDDEEYQRSRAIKVSMLNKEKQDAVDDKKKEINQDLKILKERAKINLDDELEKKVQVFKETRRTQIAHDARRKKIAGQKELSSKLLEFDKETFKELIHLRSEWLEQQRKIEANQILQEENIIKQHNLKIEEDRIKLQLEENRKAAAQAEAEISKKVTSENELMIQKEKAENKRLELALAKEQNEARQIAAKEEENRLQKEQIELKRSEVEIRNRETDELTSLVKNNYLAQFIPKQETVPVVEEKIVPMTETVSEPMAVEKKASKLTSFLTGALISGLVLLPGYYVADQAGWIDGKDAKDTQQQSADKKYKSYIEGEEFLKAYKLKENKASEIKKAALEQKDYVEAVKLADMTDDNEYLMNIYLQNGNEQGLKEKFNEMSYEERLSLNEDTQRKIADTFLKNKDYKAAEKVNETLKNKEITEKIKGQVKKKDIATKTAINNTVEGMKN